MRVSRLRQVENRGSVRRNYTARHRFRESVADRLHIISFPVEVRPNAPAGEQKAPGWTPVRMAGVGFFVVFFGFGLAVVFRGVGLLVVLFGVGVAAVRSGVVVASAVGLGSACGVELLKTPRASVC